MNEYQVVVKDADGYEISDNQVEGVKAAKEHAKYCLTDAYAIRIGTTHQVLRTFKAEVQKDGECLYDFFRKEG